MASTRQARRIYATTTTDDRDVAEDEEREKQARNKTMMITKMHLLSDDFL
jgi:hypothetical protein